MMYDSGPRSIIFFPKEQQFAFFQIWLQNKKKLPVMGALFNGQLAHVAKYFSHKIFGFIWVLDSTVSLI